jgi:hypothetical protein
VFQCFKKVLPMPSFEHSFYSKGSQILSKLSNDDFFLSMTNFFLKDIIPSPRPTAAEKMQEPRTRSISSPTTTNVLTTEKYQMKRIAHAINTHTLETKQYINIMYKQANKSTEADEKQKQSGPTTTNCPSVPTRRVQNEKKKISHCSI